MDKKKLNAKDFINIGIFTVIYFVMFFITGMLGYIPIFAVIIPLVLGNTGRHPVHAVSDKDREIRRGYYYGYAGQCPLLSDGTKLDFNSVWNCIRFPG